MAVDTIISPEIKVELQGEVRKVDFKLKNFAVLQRVHNISEGAMLQGLINGDIGMLPYAIWCGTLKFAPFDPAEPLKIESQVDLGKLFDLNLTELKELTDKIVQAVEAYLPKRPNINKTADSAKKKAVRKKKTSM